MIRPDLRAIVEAVDTALERRDLGAVCAIVEAFDPSAHGDEDLGIALLVLTACAWRFPPLQAAREALGARVRADLRHRGWSAPSIELAVGDLSLPSVRLPSE